MSIVLDDLTAQLDTLTKAVLSQPLARIGCSRVTIRPLSLRGKAFFQLEYQQGQKVTHRNVTKGELPGLFAQELDGLYLQAVLCTETETRQYIRKTNGSYKCTAKGEAQRTAAPKAHDRRKEYILAEGENIPALVDLGVFTPDLRIVKAKYDKYKQINRFIELVDDAFRASEQQEITILDFGCGKSYLTFILYYYFTVKRGVKATILGYDLKEDVVEHCNAIAQKYGYDGLRFVVSDVTRDTLADTHVDMVVTLHACDTATDYALWYAVEKGVKHIFSVPCCQHEINATIHKGGDFDVLLRHGAAHVYAIDVGYGQLDWKLRNDSRVTVMERTNARALTREHFPVQPTLTVMDVSFISIKLILPVAAQIMGEQGRFLTLVKPQFEAGKGQVGKNGVVREKAIHERVLQEICLFAPSFGWHVANLTFSPIKGPAGNIEFLADIRPGDGETISPERIEALVAQAHAELK